MLRQGGHAYVGKIKQLDGSVKKCTRLAKSLGPRCNSTKHPKQFQCEQVSDEVRALFLHELLETCPTNDLKKVRFHTLIQKHNSPRGVERHYFMRDEVRGTSFRVCAVLFSSAVGQSVATVKRWTETKSGSPSSSKGKK